LGILIGARKTLPLEIVNNFTATGVSHIVAVSGYNISIIILALEKMSWWIGRKPAFWTSLIIIIMFVIMTGASSSVIRAAVMGSLVLFSFASGRLYSITPSLFFAVIIMLLFNPKILFWDIGFQLSFLATCGIIYILPMLEQLTEKFGELFNLKSYFLTTCSAIIATTPLILFNFEKFSIVAPLVNVLVLPVVPPVMLFGFLSLVPFRLLVFDKAGSSFSGGSSADRGFFQRHRPQKNPDGQKPAHRLFNAHLCGHHFHFERVSLFFH
jgi:competence protein ComEC